MLERAVPGRNGTSQCRSLTLRPSMAPDLDLSSPSKTLSRLSPATCRSPRLGPRQRTPVSPNYHCARELLQLPLRTPHCWLLLPQAAPAVFRRCLSVRRPRRSEDWATAQESVATSWVSARASPARIAPALRPPPADGHTCGHAGLGRESRVASDTQHPCHDRSIAFAADPALTHTAH